MKTASSSDSLFVKTLESDDSCVSEAAKIAAGSQFLAHLSNAILSQRLFAAHVGTVAAVCAVQAQAALEVKGPYE